MSLSHLHPPLTGPGAAAVTAHPRIPATAAAHATVPQRRDHAEPEVDAFADPRVLAPSEAALQAVHAAARAYEQLRANGRELRFTPSDTGLRIEVYDSSGELVRRIPPTEALALAAGQEASWLA